MWQKIISLYLIWAFQIHLSIFSIFQVLQFFFLMWWSHAIRIIYSSWVKIFPNNKNNLRWSITNIHYPWLNTMFFLINFYFQIILKGSRKIFSNSWCYRIKENVPNWYNSFSFQIWNQCKWNRHFSFYDSI